MSQDFRAGFIVLKRRFRRILYWRGFAPKPARVCAETLVAVDDESIPNRSVASEDSDNSFQGGTISGTVNSAIPPYIRSHTRRTNTASTYSSSTRSRWRCRVPSGTDNSGSYDDLSCSSELHPCISPLSTPHTPGGIGQGRTRPRLGNWATCHASWPSHQACWRW